MFCCFEPYKSYTVISVSFPSNMRANMSFSGIQQFQLKRYSRWVLVLFVLSWINLIIQAPVHAGMKQEMALSQDMMSCHCPQVLCDTVLSLEDQSDDIVHFALPAISDVQIAFVTKLVDEPKQISSEIQIILADLHFRETSSPPLQQTSILLI